MIRRFSLYGFLKNQRYFEPFIILFFLQQGLSFTQIGILIGFRELFINLVEIPSGAVADLFGRRRSMVLSFIAYIISFIIFGFSSDYWHFFIAMFFFAIGEAFRTGTHKAMIFTWLRLQGRLDEKTRVYGYTRSWSKIGSIVSTILAVLFVLLTNNYSYVFFFAIVPYIIGLLNFLSYPAELEGRPEKSVSFKKMAIHLWECMRSAMANVNLRRLIIESISFEGVYKAVDTYLQPILKNIAIMLPIFILWGEAQRSSIIVGAVYIVIYFAAALASRNAYRLVRFAGNEESGSLML
jgi:MFS family permease